MAWARPGFVAGFGGGWGAGGSWIRGFVGAARGFVGSWIRGGVRGFVNGFVHSWVRELVAGFVDWFTRFRVRGVSFPKALAKGSRCLGNIPGKSCTIV